MPRTRREFFSPRESYSRCGGTSSRAGWTTPAAPGVLLPARKLLPPRRDLFARGVDYSNRGGSSSPRGKVTPTAGGPLRPRGGLLQPRRDLFTPRESYSRRGGTSSPAGRTTPTAAGPLHPRGGLLPPRRDYSAHGESCSLRTFPGLCKRFNSSCLRSLCCRFPAVFGDILKGCQKLAGGRAKRTPPRMYKKKKAPQEGCRNA